MEALKVVDQLLPISKFDIETYRTMSFFSKMKHRRDTIRNKLIENIEKNPEEVNSVMALAILNFLPSDLEDVLAQKENIEISLVNFDKILLKQPNYWLVRVYKLWLLTSIPLSFTSEELIEEELNTLISLQEQTRKQYSYFVVGYTLAARFFYNKGDMELCNEYLDKVSLLDKYPVDKLEDFLSKQLVEFEGSLMISKELEVMNKVYSIRSEFFPKSLKS